VTWTAYAKARRWLHVQRNAYRRSDHVQGRYPLSESAVVGDDADWTLADRIPTLPDEDTLDARRVFSRIVCKLGDPGEVVALEAWAVTGNSTAAADLLAADPKLVSVLNLWTPGAAQRLVQQAIKSATNVVAGDS